MKRSLSLVLPALFLPLFLFSQKNIYVDSRVGKNNFPGTLDRPVQAIQQAVDLSRPGDTIEIRGGYYFYEKSQQKKGVTFVTPLVYKTTSPGGFEPPLPP